MQTICSKKSVLLCFLTAVTIGSSSCSLDSGVDCTCEYVPGISLRVLDASTGLPATCNATGWVVQGSYMEQMSNYGNCMLPDSLQDPWMKGAWERPGVYAVIIQKEGYHLWACSNIVVTKNECHVNKIKLEALLKRED